MQAERLFKGDIATIRRFCELAQPEQLPFLDEVERAFVTEFDYAREADMLDMVATNVAASRHARRVVIPRPMRQLCSKHLLVMDYLDGKKLVDALREQYTAMAAAQGMTLEQLRQKWADKATAAGMIPVTRPTAPVVTPSWRRAALRGRWARRGLAAPARRPRRRRRR